MTTRRNRESSANEVRLVVGLGNPGMAYRNTRHNVGFMVMDTLAKGHDVALSRSRLQISSGRCWLEGRWIWLAKPQAFMNRSGPPTQALARKLGIRAEELLVVHDDIDLEFGSIKLKEKGGSAGHNGLKSLMEAFGGNQFSRLRIGIGRPEPGIEITDYVLGRFDPSQKDRIGEVIVVAIEAVRMAIREGVSKAMNAFNGRIF